MDPEIGFAAELARMVKDDSAFDVEVPIVSNAGMRLGEQPL